MLWHRLEDPWIGTDDIQVEQCANELVSTLYNLKSEQSGGYFNSTGTAYPY